MDASAATTSGTGEGSGGGWASILIMIVYIIGFAALIYFILIRPQRKKTKEEQKMRDSVQVGDEIITIGGLYGRIVSKKDDDSFIMESGADKNKIRIAKWSIQTNLTLHDE
ncbi:MAG TPA: preprotein translocase subunit YajC [Firmicutes bacterium]|nr:preprotein translocase subunit YajC [Bacillota bacterium]